MEADTAICSLFHATGAHGFSLMCRFCIFFRHSLSAFFLQLALGTRDGISPTYDVFKTFLNVDNFHSIFFKTSMRCLQEKTQNTNEIVWFGRNKIT